MRKTCIGPVRLSSWDQILCFNFSLDSLRFCSHERNWPKKSWVVLQNFNYWMINLRLHTQKSHLALGNLAKMEFWSILSCKSWSFAKLLSFFVSVSLIELRENKKHIIQTLAVSRRFVSENWLAMTTRHKLIMKNDPIWKQSKDLTWFN